jgi:hypothetical protein
LHGVFRYALADDVVDVVDDRDKIDPRLDSDHRCRHGGNMGSLVAWKTSDVGSPVRSSFNA